MGELKLTSVLNMSRDYSAIRRTVEALSAQSARENLELIVIATRAYVSTINLDELSVFGAYQIVEVDSLPTGAYGWAEGFRRAGAPIVVVSEDHGFPAPNWAETLIEAHTEEDLFAICPALENGNPDTCTSWANFLLCFVDWFAPDAARLVESAAGHNTSYKRDALLADYGAALDRWMNPERVLHYDLIARGKRILLESRTSVAHVNISLTGSYLAMSYAGGRVFGASRASQWSVGRRVLYALLFPLVPLLRLKRLLQQLDTPQKRRKSKFWKTVPLIMVGLVCHAFGEAVGYLLGSGNIIAKYTNYELNRREYVTPAERAVLLDPRTEAVTQMA